MTIWEEIKTLNMFKPVPPCGKRLGPIEVRAINWSQWFRDLDREMLLCRDHTLVWMETVPGGPYRGGTITMERQIHKPERLKCLLKQFVNLAWTGHSFLGPFDISLKP